MTEKTFKFKIVPQQERFYNENSNWGVYTFTTTSNDIPYFYDCYNDPYNVPLVKTQMKKIIVTAKTLYSHPKNVSKIYAALHTDLAW